MREENNLQPQSKLTFLSQQERHWKKNAFLQDPFPLSSFLTASSLTLSTTWCNSVKICALSHHYISATVSWCAYEEAAEENVARLIQRHFVIRFTAAPLRHWRSFAPFKKTRVSIAACSREGNQWSLGNWSVCTQWPACTNVVAGRRITYVKFLPTNKWESCIRLLLPKELLKYNQIQQTAILQGDLWSTVKYYKMLKNRRFWVISQFCNCLALALGQIWLFEYVHLSHSGWITGETLY